MDDTPGNGGSGTPPGWYPDADGKPRWWDGSRWTDQQPAPDSTGNAAAAPTQPGAEPETNPKAEAAAAKAYAEVSRPWYKMKRWWAVGAVVVIIGIAIASGGAGDDNTPATANGGGGNGSGSSSSTPSPSSSSTPTSSAPKQWYEKTAFSDGSWKVGKDFPAGNYILVNPTSSGFVGCYWSVTADPNGNHMVANGSSSGGFPYVSLLNGRYFDSQSCGDWALVPKNASPVYAKKITDGEWVAGLTMHPGQYRAVSIPSDGFGCSWAVSTTGSNGNDIVANATVQGGHPQVSVHAGQSFTSKDCGDWRKVG
jgi:hypothetical protein